MSGWQNREAEEEPGFVPLLLHTRPGICLPSGWLDPVGSVHGHLGQRGGVLTAEGRQDRVGRQNTLYLPLINYRNVIDLSKIHEVTGCETRSPALTSHRNLLCPVRSLVDQLQKHPQFFTPPVTTPLARRPQPLSSRDGRGFFPVWTRACLGTRFGSLNAAEVSVSQFQGTSCPLLITSTGYSTGR